MTWSPRLASRICVALLAAGSLTCSGDNTNPNPSDPTKLAVATQPSSTAQNGQPLAVQPAVQVQDADGNSVPAPSGSTITAVLTGGSGSLGGTLTQPVDASGKATFTDLSLTGPSGTYQIQFTSAGLTSATSNNVVLDGGPPANVAVNTQPTSALDKEVFDPTEQPVVTVTDAGGNVVPDVQVTVSIGSGSGTLQGRDTATTDANGVARFTDLGISGPGSQTLKFTAGPASGTSSPINIATLPPEATSGKWDAPVSWDIVPLHIHLLPTGKVLAWGKFEQNGSMGLPRLWDPAAGPPTTAPIAATGLDTMLFCAGHSLMSDGRLLVSGGHKSDDHGLDVTNIFDPATESWVPGLPKMAKGRWYPTVTELPDGRLVTVAGRDTTGSGNVVAIPEIWNGSQWTQLTGASLILPYYPRDFVAPDGRIFYAGEMIQSRWLNVAANGGTGQWTSGPSHLYQFNREYGSAVMYAAGKILYVGGGGDPNWNTPGITYPKASVPTATAEKIDLTAANPQWQSTGSMAFRRRHLNATVLPDGQVLVTGGVSGGGFNDVNSGVHEAEIWDPDTDDWTTLAASDPSITRAYHSVALLLPNGTVLSGASGDAFIAGTNTPYPEERNHEIFQPPYLFKGARPTITNAPNTVASGATFTVATPNAAQITTVRIIRLGSVTHAFDQNGRALILPFVVSQSGISVTAQGNPNLAPPGHYLLFILNRNGVPSNGTIIQFQ